MAVLLGRPGCRAWGIGLLVGKRMKKRPIRPWVNRIRRCFADFDSLLADVDWFIYGTRKIAPLVFESATSRFHELELLNT